MSLTEQPSHTATHILPGLPVELVEQIFKLATTLSPKAGCSLRLVSYAVHSWVTPVLFASITLSSTPADFLPIDGCLPAPPHAHHIKSLYLPIWVRNIDLLGCTHLTHLALNRRLLPRLPNLALPSLTHLALADSVIQTLRFDHPIFRSVTHLYLDAVHPTAESGFTPSHHPCLTSLVCVTTNHIILGTTSLFFDALRDFDANTKLRVVGLQVSRVIEVGRLTARLEEWFPEIDPRVAVIPACTFSHKRWKKWWMGSTSVWDTAERLLRVRGTHPEPGMR